MPKLLDGFIAKQVNSALKSAGLTKPATLIKETPGTRGATVSAGTQPTAVSYGALGVVDSYTAREIAGTSIQADDRKVTLLGASIAGGQVPATNDKIIIEGLTLRVIQVGRDPAGATYECQCRK